MNFDKAITRGKGCYLYDDQGVEYIDFLAQYGAMPFGHNPDFLWKALEGIRDRSEPSMIQPFSAIGAETLATRLVELAPGEMRYATFANSGAEVVEAAIKLSRAKTGRKTILGTKTGFHGKTLGASSLTGKPIYREDFLVDTTCFDHVALNDLKALEDRLVQGDVAAFFIEPLQGEGGMIVPDENYLLEACRLCKDHKTLFVVDEIQTGFGRTGKLFALDHYPDIKPDIVLLAKALGGGIAALGAMLCTEKSWHESFGLNHSSTFANNNVACQIGNALLDHLLENDRAAVTHVENMGNYLRQELCTLVEQYPTVFSEVSGHGLMQGLKLNPWNGNQSYFISHSSFLGYNVPLLCGYLLNKHKIITAPVFTNNAVLRLQPSLIVTKKEINKLISALYEAAELIFRDDFAQLMSYLVDDHDDATESWDSDLVNKIAAPPIKLPQINEQKLGKFAFLIHPTEYDDLLRIMPPSFKTYSDQQRAAWKDWMNSWFSKRYEPGVAYHLPCIRSKAGGYSEGWLIACPLTPERMMRLPKARRQLLMQQYLGIAHSLDVDIVGLGAFTSIVTRGGRDVSDHPVNITTGNSLTALASAESIKLAVKQRNFDVGTVRYGVIGAAGSVGCLTAKHISTYAEELVLFGNPKNIKAIRNLKVVGGEIFQIAIKSILSGKDRIEGLAAVLVRNNITVDDVSTDALTTKDEDALIQLYEKINLRLAKSNVNSPPLVISTSLEDDLPSVQAVVTATNVGRNFIDPALLHNETIVCDTARPPDMKSAVGSSRPDVFIYEGGLVGLPESIKFGADNVIGFPVGVNLACLSETIVLSMIGATKNHSIGDRLDYEEALVIYKNAMNFGFKISLYDREGEIQINSDTERNRITSMPKTFEMIVD